MNRPCRPACEVPLTPISATWTAPHPTACTRWCWTPWKNRCWPRCWPVPRATILGGDDLHAVLLVEAEFGGHHHAGAVGQRNEADLDLGLFRCVGAGGPHAAVAQRREEGGSADGGALLDEVAPRCCGGSRTGVSAKAWGNGGAGGVCVHVQLLADEKSRSPKHNGAHFRLPDANSEMDAVVRVGGDCRKPDRHWPGFRCLVHMQVVCQRQCEP